MACLAHSFLKLFFSKIIFNYKHYRTHNFYLHFKCIFFFQKKKIIQTNTMFNLLNFQFSLKVLYQENGSIDPQLISRLKKVGVQPLTKASWSSLFNYNITINPP